MMQTSISLYAPSLRRITFPPPPSSATKSNHIEESKSQLKIITTHTRCSEEDDLSGHAMSFKSGLDGNSNADTADGNEIVATGMPHTRKCVHFRVNSQY